MSESGHATAFFSAPGGQRDMLLQMWADAAVTGGAALLGALIGGISSYAAATAQAGEATKRRRGELYLEKKVDALVELHSNLVEMDRMCIEMTDVDRIEGFRRGGFTRENRSKLEDPFKRFERSKDRAAIYLGEEQNKALVEIYLEFRDIVTGVIPHEVGEMGLFVASYEHYSGKTLEIRDEAEKVLRNEVNEPINALKHK